jgi:uncharacterized protein
MKRSVSSIRRRLVLTFHGLTAFGQLAPALALGGWAEGSVHFHFVLVVLSWGLAVTRLRALARDRHRPRWLTRLVDEPLVVHWGAGLLGSALLVPVWALASLFLGDRLTASRVGLAAYGGAFLICAWGVWVRRHRVVVLERSVAIRDLPAELEGYRIVHLTDLHIGSFDGRDRGLEWVRLANGCEGDLVAVTGDLVTSGTDFYPDVAAVLGALRARDGVFVCMGNHDQWDSSALVQLIEAAGPAVLRNDAYVVQRDAAELLIAGLDDPHTGKDDLEVALSTVSVGRPTVLLSHYPSAFEKAAGLGADLVLSGHTHGGQFGLPFWADRLNLARVTGQRARGLFRAGSSTLHVSAGLGTTGPPMRIGVAPELVVLVLRGAEA